MQSSGKPSTLSQSTFSETDAFIIAPHKTSNPTKEEIQAFISYYAWLYGVSEKEMMITIGCESGFKHDGIYGDHGLAYGIAQFHEGTFNEFKKTAKMEYLEYKNIYDQINLMAWAFSKGETLKNHWTCYMNNFK